MAENYRLTRNTVTGVTNTGSNSARIYASEAEKKAVEALTKAEEALKAVSGLNDTTDILVQVNDLSKRLDAEINRSIRQDNLHTDALQNVGGTADLSEVNQKIKNLTNTLAEEVSRSIAKDTDQQARIEAIENKQALTITFENISEDLLWGKED